MGWFSSSKGTDGADSGEPSSTISDKKWFSVQKAAAGEVDVFPTPWTKPERAAKAAAWNSARDNARDN